MDSIAVSMNIHFLLEFLNHIREVVSNKINENNKYKRKESVSEIGFYDLMNIIESEHGKLETEIENWAEYLKLRKAVNSFKHNQGIKNRKDIERNNETAGIEWKWEATLEQADKYLRIMPNVIDGIRHLGVENVPNTANPADGKQRHR